MAERVPEFISLMRDIRDVYYKEIQDSISLISENSIAFAFFESTIKNPIIGTVSSIAPIDDTTFGVADVSVVSTVAGELEFSFVVPAGLKGAQGIQGTGVVIQGYDTEANIFLKTTALQNDLWIATDVPTLIPPNGVPSVNDGLLATILNPTAGDWINVGPVAGPQGAQGDQGLTGLTGAQGIQGSAWIPVTVAPGPGYPANARLGDFAILYTGDFTVGSSDGLYWRLTSDIATGTWVQSGQVHGPKGDKGDTGLDSFGSVPVNGIVMYQGLISAIPANWELMPEMSNVIPLGTVVESEFGDTGGNNEAVVPEHSHPNTSSASFTGINQTGRTTSGSLADVTLGDGVFSKTTDWQTGVRGGSYENNGNGTLNFSMTPTGTVNLSVAVNNSGVPNPAGSNLNMQAYVKMGYIKRIL